MPVQTVVTRATVCRDPGLWHSYLGLPMSPSFYHHALVLNPKFKHAFNPSGRPSEGDKHEIQRKICYRLSRLVPKGEVPKGWEGWVPSPEWECPKGQPLIGIWHHFPGCTCLCLPLPTQLTPWHLSYSSTQGVPFWDPPLFPFP